jgi:HAD superfamily hydrolase (TIGR01457 family)
MDGTLYLGERLFEGVPAFLQRLRESRRRYLFFTNNSSRDAREYAKKLTRLGIAAAPEEVITSGEATVAYLIGDAGVRRAYVLGTASFEREVASGGIELDSRQPQAVVLGFDLTLTYEKISTACRFIRAGVPFVATHPDLNCPTEEGPIPDCGAMTAMITAATGVEPVVIGKPNRYMVDAALARLGGKPENTAIVGDRLYTDMEMGYRGGLRTVLVLSGETTEADLAAAPRKPDLVIPSVSALTPLLA